MCSEVKTLKLLSDILLKALDFITGFLRFDNLIIFDHRRVDFELPLSEGRKLSISWRKLGCRLDIVHSEIETCSSLDCRREPRNQSS
jgi:hypothetical protein